MTNKKFEHLGRALVCEAKLEVAREGGVRCGRGHGQEVGVMTDAEHMERIAAHLANAKAKHPHFADECITQTTIDAAKMKLAEIRAQLKHEAKLGKVWAEDIMLCELWEVMDAYADGRAEDAVEECYDAVAILLRMAEWIQEKGCK